MLSVLFPCTALAIWCDDLYRCSN